MEAKNEEKSAKYRVMNDFWKGLILRLLMIELLLFVGNLCGYTFYINPYITYKTAMAVIGCIIYVLSFFFIFTGFEKALKFFLCFFFGALAVFILILACGFFRDLNYFHFSSPNNEHQLVVYECQVLITTEGVIYERLSPVIMRKIGDYDAHRLSPVESGMCSFDFLKDKVDFKYISVSGSSHEEIMELEYAKQVLQP